VKRLQTIFTHYVLLCDLLHTLTKLLSAQSDIIKNKAKTVENN